MVKFYRFSKKMTVFSLLRVWAIVILSGSLVLLFQNCANDSFQFASEAIKESKISPEEEQFFELLQEAKEIRLRLIAAQFATKPEDPEASLTYEDMEFLEEREATITRLGNKIEMLERLIFVDKVPVRGQKVLSEADYLVNLISKGRDILVEFASFKRDQALKNKIDIVEESIQAIEDTLAQIRETERLMQEQINDISEGLADAVSRLEKLGQKVDKLRDRMNQMDHRLALVEFKAKRAEAIAAIESRIEFNNAWIRRRLIDVRSQFCTTKTQSAFNVYDYQTAMHSWAFCHQKLKVLAAAAVRNHIAASYAKLLGSLNVDISCDSNIPSAGDKPAQSLSREELLSDPVSSEVIKNCKSGGQEVAWVAMFNVVEYLKAIGPDHRTVAFMSKLSEFPNILFLGAPVNLATEIAKSEFSQIDPTSDLLANTPYGQIERLFERRFVESVYHDKNGAFIENPLQIVIPSSLGRAFSRKDIMAGIPMNTQNSQAYLGRLKALEVESPECGFGIENRQVSSQGRPRLCYPTDPDIQGELCPIDDDVIVPTPTSEYKVYHLSFSFGCTTGARGPCEQFQPLMPGNNHVTLANSEKNVRNGDFAFAPSTVSVPRADGLIAAEVRTRYVISVAKPWSTVGPYGGLKRPRCDRFQMVPLLKYGDWAAPSGTLYSNQSSDSVYYLNGFAGEGFSHLCESLPQFPTVKYASGKTPDQWGSRTYVDHRDATVLSPGLARSWHNYTDGDPGSETNARVTALANALLSENPTTQLGPNYFMYKDAPAEYAGQKLGRDTFAFFQPIGSTISTMDFVRVSQPSGPIRVQECSHCIENIANPNPACETKLINDLESAP